MESRIERSFWLWVILLIMQQLFEDGYRLCTCKKTHKTGIDIYKENEKFFYKEFRLYFSVKRITLDENWNGNDYTYLPGDFNKHFVDTIEQRNQKIDEILKD